MIVSNGADFLYGESHLPTLVRSIEATPRTPTPQGSAVANVEIQSQLSVERSPMNVTL